ncbi:MAG TPA: oligopeptide/dipeptide ABC transporter ATP-binding protein [Alphaproteobacteria bacterium]|nr:oligopeptide/dipeptide ABC transporter ATP-binding protein [Alphaproteobacteria bacterium]
MTPVLELRGVSRRYAIRKGWFARPAELLAARDVSLDVRRGEVLAIVGETGSGKTTLGRMILGLTEPSAGEIRLDGKPLASVGRRSRSRRIQPVFQDPYSSLNPRQTIGQIIAMPLHVHRIGAAGERQRAVRQMMERVGLSPALVHSYPSQLSGGQRQRVAIARALVGQPEILVCDEPTSALDVSVQGQILNLLKDLQQSLNLTYVFITHDLAVVEYLADRVAVMYLGRIVELGTTRAMMTAPRHPYTQALLGSVLTPEPGLGLPDLHLGRGFPDPLNPPPGCPFHPRCPSATDVCRERAPDVTPTDAGFVTCHVQPAQTPTECDVSERRLVC